MKNFITLAVVCFISSTLASNAQLSEEHKNKVKLHSDECIKQENVSEEDAKRLHKKDYSNPSESMKCFSACFFEKVGVVKANTVQEEQVKKLLVPIFGEEKINKLLTKCKDVKGADRCDTGLKIFECIKTFNVHGIL